MLHLFYGHDERVEAGATAFVRSVVAHASGPVALTPITRAAWPGMREGTNAFTFRRFLVPWLMRWQGWAVFMDGADMLLRGDVCALEQHFDPYMAVQVVKHDYRTRFPRKYLGTAMEAANEHYERKNWASVMAINCSHFAWRKVDPDFINRAAPMDLLQMRFIKDEKIGALPAVWNWLVDEHGRNDAAEVLHWTAGIPLFPAHAEAPMATEWTASLLAATTCSAGLKDPA